MPKDDAPYVLIDQQRQIRDLTEANNRKDWDIRSLEARLTAPFQPDSRTAASRDSRPVSPESAPAPADPPEDAGSLEVPKDTIEY